MTAAHNPGSTQENVQHAPHYKDGVSDEIIVSMDVDEVSCDGGHGTLGHPRVWYNFDQGDRVVCGYCDRVFVKR